VAKPIEESNAGILPEQELNPLLNPLLAAHMGRWAEVYFTSPPEKRAQAVSDLVRELAGGPAPASVSPRRDGEKPVWRKAEAEEVSSPNAPKALEQPTVICASCGHANPPQQRFCGMCGTPLSSFSAPPPQPFIGEVERPAAASWDEPEAPVHQTQEDHSHESDQIRKDDSEVSAAPAPAAEYQPAEVEYPQTVGNPPWPPREQRAAEFSVLSDYESEPVRHPYRIYVGVVVAILLGLMVYKTWESNTAVRTGEVAPSAIPEASPAAKAATPAAAETPAPAPSQPTAKASNTPAPVASTAPATANKTGNETQPGVERNIAPRTPDRRVTEARIANHPAPHDGRVPQAAAAAPNPASSASGQSGSEELAAAEKYLNAAPGTARNSQQAVPWLWKSVAKKNLTATLLLSDLYLRGDGVSKSCDQARLLLDAAARKGATAAADRLRNLRAFGCR
jgi:Double zinc ribbon